MPAKQFDELRNLAIACLTLPDWRVLREWEAFPEGTHEWAWDEERGQYARCDLRGHISLRKLDDDAEIAQLTFFPGEFGIAFSPGGRFLLASGGQGLRVWDLSTPERRMVHDVKAQTAWAYHPNGRDLVFFQADSSMLQVDLTAPQQPPTLVAKLGGALPWSAAAFDPAGNRLAVLQGEGVSVVDVKTGKIVDRIVERGPSGQPARVNHVAWHPRGEFLALVVAANKIHVWDLARKQRISVLDGCRNGAVQVEFSPDGELLASNGWEGKLRFWNWRTGQQLLRSPVGLYPRFSPKGHLIIGDGHRARVVELATGREYRTLVRQSNIATDLRYGAGAIHPDGRLFAVDMNDGVRFWDLETGSEAGLIRLAFPSHVEFLPAGELLINSRGGLVCWPARTTGAAGAELRFGPPQVWGPGDWLQFCTSKDGQAVVQAARTHAIVLDRRHMERPIVLSPQADMRGVSISPDGQFAATCSHDGGHGGIKLWHARDGRFIKELLVGKYTGCAFSPDGRWLAVSGSNGGLILRVGTWTEQAVVPRSGVFSPDSRLLAVQSSAGLIHLLDPATGREKARLEDPNQDTAWLCFTPDGTRLIACSDDGKAIRVWDLRLIRQQLVELVLDWDEPPYPTAPPPKKLEPLRVTIAGTELTSSPLAMLAWELQTDSLRLWANPLDGDAYFQRGRIYLLMNNPVKALPELNLAMAFASDHAGARFLRGKLHQQHSRWQAACDDFTRLLERQPDDPKVHRMRGACRLALGDDWGAAVDYRECLLGHGNEDATLLNNLAWRLVRFSKERKNAELAAPLIENADRQSPDQSAFVHTLGATYFRLGRYQDAVSTLDRAWKLRGKEPTAGELYFLAMCRHQLGDATGAQRDFDQAVRWHDTAKLAPAQIEELQSFRTEAKTLLQAKAHEPSR